MTSAMSRPAAASIEVSLTSFDGEQGITVRQPDQRGSHYWVGCPSIYHDDQTGDYYLTYRRRHPRGVHPERGYVNTLARSRDGIHFDDIWAVTKDQLGCSSMERTCLRRRDDGWVLYLSYVDPADNRWRIDAVTADVPDAFDVEGRRPVLTAAGTGTEGVKDPYVLRVGPVWMMFASYAAARTMSDDERAAAHAEGDIYTTGLTTHPTGLATSLDGISFDWQGEVFGVGDGWDRYQARLGSVAVVDDGFLGFYDGSAGEHENYEERCGIAHSLDLRHWTRLTPEQPRLVSRHGTGSLRYVDSVAVDDRVLVYYEYARADGAHDLRVMALP